MINLNVNRSCLQRDQFLLLCEIFKLDYNIANLTRNYWTLSKKRTNKIFNKLSNKRNIRRFVYVYAFFSLIFKLSVDYIFKDDKLSQADQLVMLMLEL